MNRKTLIAALAIIGLSACSAQQRQMIDTAINNNTPTDQAVVICDPVTDTTCAPTSDRPPVIKSPPTTVYDPSTQGLECDRATLENCN